ncbi:MAG: hypothetical protein KKF50_01900 [Nanoarchaeota archaeon]|nr:hypothetical protein [Nanoarchaeota archaeon]
MRIKFARGEQRKFLDLVIEKTSSPSLRGLLQFGFDVPYSTLKNYYNESRLLPGDFFDDLCAVANIDLMGLEFEEVDENWGKIKGGKIGKRKKLYDPAKNSS